MPDWMIEFVKQNGLAGLLGIVILLKELRLWQKNRNYRINGKERRKPEVVGQDNPHVTTETFKMFEKSLDERHENLKEDIQQIGQDATWLREQDSYWVKKYKDIAFDIETLQNRTVETQKKLDNFINEHN